MLVYFLFRFWGKIFIINCIYMWLFGLIRFIYFIWVNLYWLEWCERVGYLFLIGIATVTLVPVIDNGFC